MAKSKPAYVIERDIKLPPVRLKYPFADMDVGDSFFVPIEDKPRAQSAVWAHGKRYGKEFTCRAIGDVYRIWRTA